MSTSNSDSDFTEETTQYWQEILPQERATTAPWKYGYPAPLPDLRVMMLPIRPMKNPEEPVASLIINQAGINITTELGAFLGQAVRPFNPEVVIGLPTLGLSLAPLVAQSLGQKRYVPLGYSRKFWYSDDLSAEVSSITSPSGQKRLYLDPNQVSLVKGKKAVIIDDAVSSGTTLKSTWDFLEGVGCEILVCGVVMKQGERWKGVLGPERTGKVVWAFESPLLRKAEGGWVVRD